ncbi:Gfo/Idh/MocA family protein [Rhodopirellula halodulae]|uniref:Gfo/Idh/MocA family protein n=1 Tax=Rhodopirellula halodulae TaxID=2894198 RepID=UPI001E53C63E|nr:Gfo/Idh/MocA family oxidoreductase [Rhodopirellula sp. JC737]MCC9657056.1 Gfo/Idh/MocA family oxidoreductase [Rhodopirellula sp. JC737]
MKPTQSAHLNAASPMPVQSGTTRRRWMQMAGATLGVAAASQWQPATSNAAESTDPDRPLNLAIIGVANRGASNVAGVKSQNLTALCDVDENYLQAASKQFPKARLYRDYREMIREEGELDGVVISTPDHHHAPATIRAIESGLHVYCEKPLTHTVAEARAIRLAAKEAGVVTQMGTQIHAGSNYRRVVEMIQDGVIGNVTRVHVWVGKGWGATELPSPKGEAPSNVDWDLWLGPAPKIAYTPGLHPASWRRYRAYGAGTLGDMGCHYVDLPFWALGLHLPSSIVADGAPPSDDYCPTGLKVRYHFDATDHHDEIDLTWYDGDRSPKELEGISVPGSGVLFVGDKGMMIATYGSYTLLPKEKFADFKPAAPRIAESIGHHQEWIQAIRGQGTPLCQFDYSGPLTETVLLGTVAHQCGRELKFNASDMVCVGDDAATALLSKDYREGWSVDAAATAKA